jgi:DNA polymerase-3 subunit alpha
MAFIFDVETTGLPCKGIQSNGLNYTNLSKYDTCRMVQISYIVVDKELNIIHKDNHIIQCGDFRIRNGHFHGITEQISREHGITIAELYWRLTYIFKDITHIYAHNASFDINVLRSELYRYGFLDLCDRISNTTTLCTIQISRPILNLKCANINRIKAPTLEELFKYTNGGIITNAHNAEYDTLHLYMSIVGLVKSGKYELPNINNNIVYTRLLEHIKSYSFVDQKKIMDYYVENMEVLVGDVVNNFVGVGYEFE